MCCFCIDNDNLVARDTAEGKKTGYRIYLDLRILRDDVDGSAVLNAAVDDFLETTVEIKFCPFCGEKL